MGETMDEDIKIEESSGNVFLDLGFGEEEAKEELLKAQRFREGRWASSKK